MTISEDHGVRNLVQAELSDRPTGPKGLTWFQRVCPSPVHNATGISVTEGPQGEMAFNADCGNDSHSVQSPIAASLLIPLD